MSEESEHIEGENPEINPDPNMVQVQRMLSNAPPEKRDAIKTLLKDYQETKDDVQKKKYEEQLKNALNDENIKVTTEFLDDIKSKVKLEWILDSTGKFIDTSIQEGFKETIYNKLEEAKTQVTGRPIHVILAIIIVAIIGLVSIIFSVLFLIGGILGAVFALRMNPGKTGLARKSKIMLGFTWNWLYVAYGIVSYK
jgi:uncharacterized membrane protein